jgi:hypothetical protein
MLKPVDLQTIMPRTVDLQRMQQTQNNRLVVAQQELEREMPRLSQVKQDTVQQGDASAEGNRIEDDALDSQRRRDRRYRRSNQPKNAGQKAEPEKLDDLERGQHLDITI